MKDEQATVCIHRWRIAEPDGRKMLPATCGNCGAYREYKSVADDLNWSHWTGININDEATAAYKLYPLLGRKEQMTR